MTPVQNRREVVDMRFITIGIAIAIAAALLGGHMMRKNLPYQFDIVQTKDSIAVVNRNVWNQRPLKVVVRQSDSRITTGVIHPRYHSEWFRNIPDSGRIEVVISRQDLTGRLLYRPKTLSVERTPSDQAYVVLVGASIGRQWHLGDLNKRVSGDGVVFSSRAHYDFDKTDTLMPLLDLKVKPDAIIIKECADYFPRKHDESTTKLMKWVDQVKKSGVQPILATTVPVTQTGPKSESQPSIVKWNTFVRDYAQQHQIPLLDLAVALQVSDINDYLKDEFAKEDGYHLTTAAYRQVLDPLLNNFTKEIITASN